jgi:plasmid maintenance system antidote protein VapI
MMNTNEPAEVFHPAEFICEELLARGWTTEDVAVRMDGNVIRNLIALDLYLCVHRDNLLLDDVTCGGLAKAFGVSSQFFKSLDTSWRSYPDRRVPFTPPEGVFGETSRNAFVDF